MCSYGKLVDPYELIENPKNPNRHPEKQIEILAKLIKSQGFRRPIVVSNRSGFVTVGHGRLLAAKYLEMETVPVDYQDYESEAKEWADMVADNKVAEFAEFDNSVLSDMLQDLDDFDEELFGMAQDDIDKIMGRVNGQYSKIIRRKSTLVNLMMRNLNILAPGAGLNFDHGRVFL